MLDGRELLKPSEKTKTRCIFSLRTKIPTLIVKIEHDFSSTISISYVFEENKIGHQLTQQNDVNVSLGSFSDGVCYDSS